MKCLQDTWKLKTNLACWSFSCNNPLLKRSDFPTYLDSLLDILTTPKEDCQTKTDASKEQDLNEATKTNADVLKEMGFNREIIMAAIHRYPDPKIRYEGVKEDN